MNKLIIELGGKQRTLKFNMLFLEEFEKKRKDSQGELANTACMIYAGIKAYADITDTPMDCTYEDCYDWSEEMLLNNDVSTIEKILEAYQQSTVYKATQEALKKNQARQIAEMNGLIGEPSNGTLSEKSGFDQVIITI